MAYSLDEYVQGNSQQSSLVKLVTYQYNSMDYTYTLDAARVSKERSFAPFVIIYVHTIHVYTG
jgi:hypothetical protein